MRSYRMNNGSQEVLFQAKNMEEAIHIAKNIADHSHEVKVIEVKGEK